MSFQSESKVTGDQFEYAVYQDLLKLDYLDIKKNVFISEAGIEIDYVSGNNYIEAKGGLDGDKKRPGAKRTDNVKKAIANGALLKAVKPESYYIVYFSAKPLTNSSSDIMIKTALCHKIIDEVRYIQNKNIDLFDTLFDCLEW